MITKFVASIDRHLAGVEFFSVGCRAGCEECNGSDEGHFSWSSCDSCGSSLGGDRFPAHGFVRLKNGQEVLAHFNVCTDCRMFHAYGDEPEEWRSA